MHDPTIAAATERMIPTLGVVSRDPLASLEDDVRRAHGHHEEAERLPATTPNSVTIDSASAFMAARALSRAARSAPLEVALELAAAAEQITAALQGRRRRLH